MTTTADIAVRPISAPVKAQAASRWLGLGAILAATLMNLMDSTIVNVAAPAIQASLGGTYTSLQWVAASYVLALAVGLLTGGRLGDMYGRRRMLFVGVSGFVVASLGCALAWSPGSLIAARVLLGLFGAVMIPQSFGLIRDLFPGAEMGKAFAVFGPAIGLSTILGPIVAGVLVDADILGTGWRSIFLINLPLGAFALVAGSKALPASIGDARVKLDLAGAAVAGVGMFLLVFPLVQGRELGWPLWTFAMLLAAVPVFGFFARYQLRRKASGATPLVELSVFAKRAFASGAGFVTAFFGSVAGVGLAVGMYLQLELGYSPTRASLTMAAWAVGAFMGSGVGATQQQKLGRKLLHTGLVVMSLGLGVSALALGSAWVMLSLFAFGLGMGMIFVPLFDIIMAGVEDAEVGSASGALESIQQLGAALGVAVMGTVLFGASPDWMAGAQRCLVISIVLAAVAFGLGFLLPRQARQH